MPRKTTRRNPDAKNRSEAMAMATEALARGRSAYAAGHLEWAPYGRPQWRGAPLDCLEIDHRTGKIADGFWDTDYKTFRPRAKARRNPPARGTKQHMFRHGFGGSSPGAKALYAQIGRGEPLISYVVIEVNGREASCSWMVGTGNTVTDIVMSSDAAYNVMAEETDDEMKEAAVRGMLENMAAIGGDNGSQYGVVIWNGKPISRARTINEVAELAPVPPHKVGGRSGVQYRMVVSGTPTQVSELKSPLRGWSTR